MWDQYEYRGFVRWNLNSPIITTEDLFKFIRKWVLFIKEKVDGFRKEREIKEKANTVEFQHDLFVIVQYSFNKIKKTYHGGTFHVF